MTEQNQSPEPSQKDLDAMGVTADATKIKDVQEMGNVVTHWHYTVLTDFHHKLRMPENVGIDIPTGEKDAEGNDVVIDGNEDHKAGFLAGISYAIERMETFPIKGVPQDEQPSE